MQGIMEWEKVREAIINNFGEQHWGRGFSGIYLEATHSSACYCFLRILASPSKTHQGPLIRDLSWNHQGKVHSGKCTPWPLLCNTETSAGSGSNARLRQSSPVPKYFGDG